VSSCQNSEKLGKKRRNIRGDAVLNIARSGKGYQVKEKGIRKYRKKKKERPRGKAERQKGAGPLKNSGSRKESGGGSVHFGGQTAK